MSNIYHHKNNLFAKWAIIVLSGFTLFTSCNKKEEINKEEVVKTKSTESITYQTEPILLIQPEYNISIPGELEPSEQVSLYAKVEGFIQKLHLDIGDYVKKGQLMATLDAPELNQKYVSDKSAEQKIYSDYQYAKKNYERLRDAAKTKGAVAELELERAKSAMNSAESAYNASKAQTGHSQQMQNYLKIVAPFSGIITERNVSEGALVGPGSGQPIFKLAQENNLKLRIALPEKHVASIRDSMNVSFTVNSQPGHTFNAMLSRSSKLINRSDRAVILEFDVENEEQQLNGGEYAQVKLNLQRKSPTFWVSEKNILNTQSGSYILIEEKNEIREILIKEGIRLDDKIEVFGDFKKGDMVIIRPTERMLQ